MKDINEILNSKDKKVIEAYLELQEYYENKFGKNVIILYELGSFYEVYQVGDKGKAIEVSQAINILLTKKNKKIDKVDMSNPFMCGLPSIKLDKYIDILLKEDKYTIIVIKQEGSTNNITRKVDRIISSGTNLESNNKNLNNYITSIIFEKALNDIIIGSASYIDVSSGNVYCYEIYGSNEDKELAIDEIYKLFNTYYGKEIIINFENFTEEDITYVINKLNLENKSYIVKNLEDSKKSLNISYQNKLLNTIYNVKSMLSPIEYFNMELYTNMTNSLILLLEFIIDHNNSIVNNLKEPIVLNNEKYLMLGNNAAEQLELLSTKNNKGLIDIITKGCTPFGKRFINQRLLNPILDKNEINRRYENSFKFINFNETNTISDYLINMHDLEKLFRKVVIKNIQPFELYNFYETLTIFFKIYKIILKNEDLKSIDFIKSLDLVNLIKIYKNIETSFDLDMLQQYSLNTINNTFIKKGVKEDLDDTILKYNNLYKDIENLGQIFLNLVDENKIFDINDTTIKLNQNDTDGYFFTMTKKRFDLIKDKLKDNFINLNNENLNLENDFDYKNLVGTIKITSLKLTSFSDELKSLKESIITQTIEFFNNFIEDLINSKDVVNNLINSLGELEFSILNTNLYKNNAYCKPEILDLGEDTFYEAIELRHPIIEKIENKGIFVPNTIVIGKKDYISENNKFEEFYKEKNTTNINGIMLYGINSSGKCLNPLDKVMMYDNTIKYVKDVVVGDKLMGDDSTPRKVLGTTKGKDTMYKITFKNGDTFECNGEHILCLKSCNYKTITEDKKSNRYRVVWYEGFSKKSKTFMYKYLDKNKSYKDACLFLKTLKDDYKEYTISMNDYLKLNSCIKRNFIMYKNKVNYKSKKINIEPYLLGYWLGDGTSSNSNITTTNNEVLKYISELKNHSIKDYGNLTFNVVENKNINFIKNICPICNKNHKNNFYCSNKCKYIGDTITKNNFKHHLNKYNLINNKHIPKDYLFNNEKVRMGLLAGIIDSDGYLSKNGMYEITQKNEILSEDIEKLAKSLGLYVYKRKVNKTCVNNGYVGTYYRISIGGELLKKLPIQIPYKQVKNIKMNTNSLRGMYSFKVENVGVGDFAGFELDGNHKFLLHDFTVSHNSSCMKSIGLSVALAQAGMFVPAKGMRYTIYDSIFTRISGSDDIYKGLSSFAVEMLELKNIFNRINKKSLVLGDEISHGTETISGMSIVASTIINLIKKNYHFVFATHLHQLNDLEEIKTLDSMINLHLAVNYNEQEDKLIYNRKLAYGTGSSVYGLEFAKFLKLDKDFLKVANDIRMKIAEDLTNIEFISKKKTSSYNKNVFFTKCVFCNNKATEIHHIKEQQNSNNGVIDHHRLNHEFNLVPLCQKHHDIIHKYQDSKGEPLLRYIQTTDGIELEVDETLKDKL